jgi:hypothetical protein
MPDIRGIIGSWLRLAGVGLDPYEAAVRKAQVRLNRIVAGGTLVSDEISQPILQAAEAIRLSTTTSEIQQKFYRAYSRLAKLAPHQTFDEDGEPENSLRDALEDAQLLLKYAAETGTEIPKDVVEPILTANAAYRSGDVGNAATASFYDAYSRLAKLFGDVTADTIRNCSSPETRRTLSYNRRQAVAITLVIAAFSLITFVADSISKGIVEDTVSANRSAATLRAGLTPPGGPAAIGSEYASKDPCELINVAPSDVGQTGTTSGPTDRTPSRSIQSVSDVEELQQFATTIRDIRGRAIKLNLFLGPWGECDPFDPTQKCAIPGPDGKPQDSASLNRQLQLNPAILNYTAEVLCKIKTYQLVRTFATNVQTDYAAIVGAFASYLLPIVYSLLGAYAYRLRLFGETIRKRTYHPSFSDSARMITAVIAGAIAGLFNPAQGLSLSPLATAFLVGYGVELFFKFLDTLINAFGPPSASRT